MLDQWKWYGTAIELMKDALPGIWLDLKKCEGKKAAPGCWMDDWSEEMIKVDETWGFGCLVTR
jgi:hypothetical protein